MICVLTRMPCEDTETHEEEHRVKTEAAVGGIGMPRLPAATRSQEETRKGLSLDPSEEAWPC